MHSRLQVSSGAASTQKATLSPHHLTEKWTPKPTEKGWPLFFFSQNGRFFVLKFHWQLKMVRSWKTKRSWDKKTKTVKSAPPVLLTLLPSPTTPPSTSTTGSKYRRQPLIQEIQLLTTRKYNCLFKYKEYTTAHKQEIILPTNYISSKTGDGFAFINTGNIDGRHSNRNYNSQTESTTFPMKCNSL